MLFHLLQAAVPDSLAETAAQAVQTAAPQVQEKSLSMIELATKGGWVMVVLLVLSIVAIYIFGKKWWMIHKAQQVDKNFMRDIRDYIHEGKTKSAVSLCQKYDSPVARLVEKGIERIKEHTISITYPSVDELLSFLKDQELVLITNYMHYGNFESFKVEDFLSELLLLWKDSESKFLKTEENTEVESRNK